MTVKAILLLLLGSLAASAQSAEQIEALASGPTLSAWLASHAGDKVDLAHYDAWKDPYEVGFGDINRWCAAAVSQSGAALFYVPPFVHRELPARADTRACRLEALWYQTPDLARAADLVKALSAAWGNPNGASGKPDIRGSGYWNIHASWQRNGISIWVASDPHQGTEPGAAPRLVVYATADPARTFDGQWMGTDDAAEMQIARATAQLLGGGLLSEPRGDLDRLERWLVSARTMPAARRAAALLQADFYMPSPSAGCPQDGPAHGHNYREESEKLDPTGPAGELAALAAIGSVCSLRGDAPWPDLVIQKGAGLLRRNDEWTPWLNLQLARAHERKLAFALPGGDPEGGEIRALTPAAMERERAAAIVGFRAYLQAKPDAPDAAVAWQEAWRLLAGLPPGEIHFGCGCE